MKEKDPDKKQKDNCKLDGLCANCNICNLYKKIMKCEECKAMDKTSMPQ